MSAACKQQRFRTCACEKSLPLRHRLRGKAYPQPCSVRTPKQTLVQCIDGRIGNRYNGNHRIIFDRRSYWNFEVTEGFSNIHLRFFRRLLLLPDSSIFLARISTQAPQFSDCGAWWYSPSGCFGINHVRCFEEIGAIYLPLRVFGNAANNDVIGLGTLTAPFSVAHQFRRAARISILAWMCRPGAG
jgi:hypothetical protein